MTVLDDTVAVRHLLRHLNDPRALRRNVLSSPFFETVTTAAKDNATGERLKTLVADCIESLARPKGEDFDATHASRQYYIVKNYDLAREPRNQVAADLGIVVSTFYLERRAALQRLADAIRSHSPSLRAIESARQEDLALDYADSLAASGQLTACISVLQSVTAVADPASRLTAWRHLIEVFVESGRLGDAAEVLEQMHRTATALWPRGPERAAVTAELCYARSHLSRSAGETEAALGELCRARQLLTSAQVGTRVGRMLLISVLQSLGKIHNECGSLNKAADFFTEALRIIDTLVVPPARLRIQSLLGLSSALGALPGRMQAASKLSRSALELAKGTGFLREIALANVNESNLCFWRSEYQEALQHAALAQPIADVVLGKIEAAELALHHARAEAACGSGALAYKRLRNARRLLLEKSYLWAMVSVLESEILTRRRADATALNAARSAVRAAEMSDVLEAYGCARLILAECYSRRHRLREAKYNAKEALSSLEHHGSAFALAQAFSLSARLTGDRSHLANATEIRRALRA